MAELMKDLDLEDKINYQISLNNEAYKVEALACFECSPSMVWKLNIKKETEKKKSRLRISLSKPFIKIEEQTEKDYVSVFHLGGSYYQSDTDLDHFLKSVNDKVIKYYFKKLVLDLAKPLLSEAHDYFNRNFEKFEEK